ncbi:MAG TPA: M56 family metallopeptidase [Bryobacteraceae bacterium]|nr:M56 family metallopeptidase [Bryobacteraceae bacterium]
MSFSFLAVLAAKATVLAVAALLCLFFSRRSSASTRHLVCTGSFGALLALPVLLLVMPAWLPESAVPLWLPAVSNAHIGLGSPASGLLNWQVLTEAVWAAGIAFGLARIGLGFVLLNRALKRGESLTNTCWQSDLADISGKLALNPHLIRLSLGRVNTPVTFGFRKPVILLPQAADNWTALYRHTVLLHELAHIRRRDWLWNCLAQIALTVFWFHPLVWALYGALRREEELACDDESLGHGIQPAAYAAVLLEMARNVPSRFLLVNGMSGKGSAAHLRARFAHILQGQRSTSANSQAGKAAIGSLLLVLAVCTSFNFRDTQPPKTVYNIGGEIAAPRLLSKVEPKYSDAAKTDKLEGTVILLIIIQADGTPSNIQVVRSLRPDLDANAIDALQQWRFAPATRQGVPVTVKAQVEINFKLL